MEWFLLAWKRAAEFSGRSRRKEYWMFQLFNMLIGMLLGIMGVILGEQDGPMFFAITCGVYGLVSFVPNLSCAVRRLHDTGKSGWWYCISFVPLLGAIILLVFLVLDSDPERNEYGPNPKLAGYGNVII
jgi:uncharacterized membrane protein YhaH (DUF805 family)